MSLNPDLPAAGPGRILQPPAAEAAPEGVRAGAKAGL